jgi:hypothetical protein
MRRRTAGLGGERGGRNDEWTPGLSQRLDSAASNQDASTLRTTWKMSLAFHSGLLAFNSRSFIFNLYFIADSVFFSSLSPIRFRRLGPSRFYSPNRFSGSVEQRAIAWS